MITKKNFTRNYKISVVVPVYNIEAYLPCCLESIMKQTYHNLQIILVDDGSTDMSGSICDDYARKDTRIQVIHKKNGGLVSARKSGLREADGDYIGFVDGDDYIDPTFYEILLADMLEKQVDFVHTGFISERNGIHTQICHFESSECHLTPNNKIKIINEFILTKEKGYEISPSIWSKLFKSEFIKKCYDKVPDQQSFGEDLCCLCICLLEAAHVYFHKIALYHYNLRDNSMTNSVTPAFMLKMAMLYNSLRVIFENYGIARQTELYLDTCIVRDTFSSLSKCEKLADYLSAYTFCEPSLLRGKRIVIYAAGIVGKGYYSQLCKYTSCRIVGWVDKDFEKIHFDYTDVTSIESIMEMQYDVVLIAVESNDTAMEISRALRGMGIPANKIMWKKPKSII